MAAFLRMQKWPQTFRQAHICYFRDKFLVFARNCKLANLTQYNLQYPPCNAAFLVQETLFLTQTNTFLPKDFQKVRKSRQILISPQNMLGLKIFVGVQTFRRRPFLPSHNFCHPGHISSKSSESLIHRPLSLLNHQKTRQTSLLNPWDPEGPPFHLLGPCTPTLGLCMSTL